MHTNDSGPRDPTTLEGKTMKKKTPALTSDELATIVANKLEKTRLSTLRKHHSKKSVKSVGKQKGSKLKADKKQLISLEF